MRVLGPTPELPRAPPMRPIMDMILLHTLLARITWEFNIHCNRPKMAAHHTRDLHCLVFFIYKKRGLWMPCVYANVGGQPAWLLRVNPVASHGLFNRRNNKHNSRDTRTVVVRITFSVSMYSDTL